MSVPVCEISGVWWLLSTVPLGTRKLKRFGICSMSDGTFGLSRRKWTLSNCRAMTCLIAPLAEFSWQPALGFAACAGSAAVAMAKVAAGSIAAATKRTRRDATPRRFVLIGVPPLTDRRGRRTRRPPSINLWLLGQQRLALGDQRLSLLLVDGLTVERRGFQHGDHLAGHRVALVAQRAELVLDCGVGRIVA